MERTLTITHFLLSLKRSSESHCLLQPMFNRCRKHSTRIQRKRKIPLECSLALDVSLHVFILICWSCISTFLKVSVAKLRNYLNCFRTCLKLGSYNFPPVFKISTDDVLDITKAFTELFHRRQGYYLERKWTWLVMIVCAICCMACWRYMDTWETCWSRMELL